jgi:hypothetical protein
MDLRVDVVGVDRLDKQMAGLVDRGSHLQPALDAAGDELLNINRRRFASEGDGSWAPLRPSTVRQRGSAHPILQDGGDLAESLTTRGARGSVRALTADSVTIATELHYAFYQSPRVIVAITAADRARLYRTVEQHLEDGL